MKSKTKWILGGGASALAVVCVAALVYFQFFFHIDLPEPGPVNSVNLAGWEKLEIGMSRQEVSSLLGEPGSQRTTKRGEGDDTTVIEGWEYNWTSGFFGDPHPKAYVVFFDEKGKLTSWREPAEKENPEQDN